MADFSAIGRWGAIPGIAILIAGMTVGPPVCSCVKAHVALASGLKFGPLGNHVAPDEVDLIAMSKVATSEYVGQGLSSVLLPDEGADGGCAPASSATVRCAYWFEQGVLRSKGWQVRIDLDSEERIRRIQVGRVTRWFGVLQTG